MCAAAVADWRVEPRAHEKIKKSRRRAACRFRSSKTRTSCARSRTTQRPPEPRDRLRRRDREGRSSTRGRSCQKKGCDWIVANDVSPDRRHGRRRQPVHLMTASGAEAWPLRPRRRSPARWSQRIAERCGAGRFMSAISVPFQRLPHGARSAAARLWKRRRRRARSVRRGPDDTAEARARRGPRSRPASRLAIPDGFEGQVRPRSGLALGTASPC